MKHHALPVISILLFLTSAVATGATLYVSPNGSHAVPFGTWATAATNIQTAVDQANPGDLVLVTNGIYATGGAVHWGLSNRVVCAKAITVKSVNGYQSTIIEGQADPAEMRWHGCGTNSVRCAYVTNGAALIGFTLRNGHSQHWIGDRYKNQSGGGVFLDHGGLLSNCLVISCGAYRAGGGVLTFYGGEIIHCTLKENLSQTDSGGGVYGNNGGTLDACIVISNTSFRGGGGVTYGTVKNSWIINNYSRSSGGGIERSLVRNSTIAGNVSGGYGGGACRATIRNSILYFNTGVQSDDNYYDCTIAYSCTTPLPVGSGNITNLPGLVSQNNRHIVSNSPCRNAGNNSYASGDWDIDSEPRIYDSTVDIGCDEFTPSGITGTFQVAINAEAPGAVIQVPISFKSDILGKVNGYHWQAGDGHITSNRSVYTHAYTVTGMYAVILTAWNNDRIQAATTTVSVTEFFTNYVSLSGNHTYPYTTWASAAQTVQDAINAASVGGVVLIAPGTYRQNGDVYYGVSNRVVISKNVTVSGAGGEATDVLIVGEGPVGPAAVRCAYLGDQAVLTSVTLTNGYTFDNIWQGGGYADESGGGAWCADGAILSNCHVTGNTAWDFGGGVYGGNMVNCRVYANTARYGGGIGYGNAWRSSIYNNYVKNNGGGSYFGSLRQCVISDNTAWSGGGGVCGGTHYNNLVCRNHSENSGGGTYDSILYNSTIIGNSAKIYAGGCQNGTLINSIVYYNSAFDNINFWQVVFTNSCTTPMPEGEGTITNAPGLASLCNPHLLAGSVCIDAGTNAYVRGNFDIDGETRIYNSTVDIGCDEVIPLGMTGSLSVVFAINYSNVVLGIPVTCDSWIQGKVNEYVWRFGDGLEITNKIQVTHLYETTGQFDIILSARNNEQQAAATVTVTVIEHFTNYASHAGSHQSPFTSWTTAAATIQDAIDAAYAGGVVVVAPGTYAENSCVQYGMSNRVGIAKPLTVMAVSGNPNETIIVGQGPPGSSAIRCAYIGDNGLLTGFTLSNGFSRLDGVWDYEETGGGAWCENGGTVSNCIVCCCGANSGGGIYLNYYGSVCSSIIRDNVAFNSGGGIYSKENSSINTCIISGNRANWGGGNTFEYGGTMDNSVVCNNLVTGKYSSAGGLYCVYGGVIRNCTVVGNSAEGSAGGVYAPDAVFQNTIIYHNIAPANENFVYGGFYNCCTFPNPDGSDNLTNDPQWIDYISGDYHLKPGSACINAGSNACVFSDTDLEGRPRIIDGTVDMGAYEYAPYPIIGVIPPAIDFGDVYVGSSTNSTVIIHNNGGITLTGQVENIMPPFCIDPGSSATYIMPEYSSDAMVFCFEPAEYGPTGIVVTLTGGGGTTVSLKGFGIPEPALAGLLVLVLIVNAFRK